MLIAADGVREQGACGYGVLNKNSYPFWSVAALSLSNQFSIAGPAKACGQCFEIKCVDIGGQFAVRMRASLAERACSEWQCVGAGLRAFLEFCLPQGPVLMQAVLWVLQGRRGRALSSLGCAVGTAGPAQQGPVLIRLYRGSCRAGAARTPTSGPSR